MQAAARFPFLGCVGLGDSDGGRRIGRSAGRGCRPPPSCPVGFGGMGGVRRIAESTGVFDRAIGRWLGAASLSYGRIHRAPYGYARGRDASGFRRIGRGAGHRGNRPGPDGADREFRGRGAADAGRSGIGAGVGRGTFLTLLTAAPRPGPRRQPSGARGSEDEGCDQGLVGKTEVRMREVLPEGCPTRNAPGRIRRGAVRKTKTERKV